MQGFQFLVENMKKRIFLPKTHALKYDHRNMCQIHQLHLERNNVGRLSYLFYS